MKSVITIFAAILFFSSCGSSKKIAEEKVETTSEQVTENVETVQEEIIDITKIEWLDFETAIDKNSKHKKFIFIDIYTDWCGWCKKMDATTFVNNEVIRYMNTYFYAVKMNAESKEPIAYKGVLYEYKQYNERSGYNTLAVNLLNSKMSFPSFVVLNKNEVKKGNIIGYKDAKTLLGLLNGYVGE